MITRAITAIYIVSVAWFGTGFVLEASQPPNDQPPPRHATMELPVVFADGDEEWIRLDLTISC